MDETKKKMMMMMMKEISMLPSKSNLVRFASVLAFALALGARLPSPAPERRPVAATST